MTARHLAVFVTLSLVAIGCGTGDRPRVPDGPSASITTAASVPPASPTFGRVVSCSGPSDEIAALGALCTSASAFHRIGAPTSGVMRVGASGSPYLVIVGYPAAGSPEDGPFDATQLGYQAFLVTSGPSAGSGVVAELEGWQSGTALAGELRSTSFGLDACSTSWVGGGTLTFGRVTLTLSWSSTIPC